MADSDPLGGGQHSPPLPASLAGIGGELLQSTVLHSDDGGDMNSQPTTPNQNSVTQIRSNSGIVAPDSLAHRRSNPLRGDNSRPRPEPLSNTNLTSNQSFAAMKAVAGRVEGLRASDLVDEDIHGALSPLSDSGSTPLGYGGGHFGGASGSSGGEQFLERLNSVKIEFRKPVVSAPTQGATGGAGGAPAKKYLTLKHRGTITDNEGIEPVLHLQEHLHQRAEEISEMRKVVHKVHEERQNWEIQENVLKGQLRSRGAAVDVLRRTLWQDLMSLRVTIGFRDERILEYQRKQREKEIKERAEFANQAVSGVEGRAAATSSPTTSTAATLANSQQPESLEDINSYYKSLEFTYLDAFKLLEEEPNEDGSNLQEGTRRLFSVLKMEFAKEKEWMKERYEKTVAGIMLDVKSAEEKLRECQGKLAEAEAQLNSSVGDVALNAENQLKKVIKEAEAQFRATERSYEEKLDAKEEEVFDLGVAKKELESELVEAKEFIETLEKRLGENAAQELAAAETKIKEASAQVREKDAELYRVKTALSNVHRDKMEVESQVAEQQGKITDLELELKKAKEAHEEMVTKAKEDYERMETSYKEQFEEFRNSMNEVENRSQERKGRLKSHDATGLLAQETLDATADMWKEEAMAHEQEISELQTINKELRDQVTTKDEQLTSEIGRAELARNELEALEATHDVLKGRIEGDIQAMKRDRGRARPMAAVLTRVNASEVDTAIFNLNQLERIVLEKQALGTEDFTDALRKSIYQMGKRVEVGQQMLLAEIDEESKARRLPEISDERTLQNMQDFEYGPLEDDDELAFFAKEEEKIEEWVEKQVNAFRSSRALAGEAAALKAREEMSGGVDDIPFDELVQAQSAFEDQGIDLNGDDDQDSNGRGRAGKKGKGFELSAKSLGQVDLDDTGSRSGSKKRGPGSIASGKARSVRSARSSRRRLQAYSGEVQKSEVGVQSGITWVETAPALIPGTNKSKHKIKLNVKAWMFDDEDSEEDGAEEGGSKRKKNQEEHFGLPVWRLADATTMTEDVQINDDSGDGLLFEEFSGFLGTSATMVPGGGLDGSHQQRERPSGSFLQRQQSSLTAHQQRQAPRQKRPSSALAAPTRSSFALLGNSSGNNGNSVSQGGMTSRRSHQLLPAGTPQERLPDVYTQDAVSVAMDYVHRGISHLCGEARCAMENIFENGGDPFNPLSYAKSSTTNTTSTSTSTAGPAGGGGGQDQHSSSSSSSNKITSEALIHRWFGIPVNNSVHPFSEKWSNNESLSWLYKRGETFGSSPSFLLDVIELRIFSLLEIVASERERLKEFEMHMEDPVNVQGAAAKGTHGIGGKRPHVAGGGLHAVAASVQAQRFQREDLAEAIMETHGEGPARSIVSPSLMMIAGDGERYVTDLSELQDPAEERDTLGSARGRRSSLTTGKSRSVGAAGKRNFMATREVLKRSSARSFLLPSTLVDIGIDEVAEAMRTQHKMVEDERGAAARTTLSRPASGVSRPSSALNQTLLKATPREYTLQLNEDDQMGIGTSSVLQGAQYVGDASFATKAPVSFIPEHADAPTPTLLIEDNFTSSVVPLPPSSTGGGVVYAKAEGPTLVGGAAPKTQSVARPLSAGGNYFSGTPAKSSKIPSSMTPIYSDGDTSNPAPPEVPGQPDDVKVVFLTSTPPPNSTAKISDPSLVEEELKYVEAGVVPVKGFSCKNAKVLLKKGHHGSENNRPRNSFPRDSAETRIQTVMNKGAVSNYSLGRNAADSKESPLQHRPGSASSLRKIKAPSRAETALADVVGKANRNLQQQHQGSLNEKTIMNVSATHSSLERGSTSSINAAVLASDQLVKDSVRESILAKKRESRKPALPSFDSIKKKRASSAGLVKH